MLKSVEYCRRCGTLRLCGRPIWVGGPVKNLNDKNDTLYFIDGDIVWSHFLREITPLTDQPLVTVIEQRTTAHFPLPPQCVLIAPLSSDDGKQRTAVYTFNPLNGEGLEAPASVFPFKVLHVAELPIEGM